MTKPNPYFVPNPVTPEWYNKIYLPSEHWRLRRRNYFASVGRQCMKCIYRRATQIDHLTYARLWCERDGDLMALCRECHQKKHGLGAANDNDQLVLPIELPLTAANDNKQMAIEAANNDDLDWLAWLDEAYEKKQA